VEFMFVNCTNTNSLRPINNQHPVGKIATKTVRIQCHIVKNTLL